MYSADFSLYINLCTHHFFQIPMLFIGKYPTSWISVCIFVLNISLTPPLGLDSVFCLVFQFPPALPTGLSRLVKVTKESKFPILSRPLPFPSLPVCRLMAAYSKRSGGGVCSEHSVHVNWLVYYVPLAIFTPPPPHLQHFMSLSHPPTLIQHHVWLNHT